MLYNRKCLNKLFNSTENTLIPHNGFDKKYLQHYFRNPCRINKLTVIEYFVRINLYSIPANFKFMN